MPCPRWDSNVIPALVALGSGGNMTNPGQSNGCMGLYEAQSVDIVHTSLSAHSHRLTRPDGRHLAVPLKDRTSHSTAAVYRGEATALARRIEVDELDKLSFLGCRIDSLYLRFELAKNHIALDG